LWLVGYEATFAVPENQPHFSTEKIAIKSDPSQDHEPTNVVGDVFLVDFIFEMTAVKDQYVPGFVFWGPANTVSLRPLRW